jgi:hypothetical protein
MRRGPARDRRRRRTGAQNAGSGSDSRARLLAPGVTRAHAPPATNGAILRAGSGSNVRVGATGEGLRLRSLAYDHADGGIAVVARGSLLHRRRRSSRQATPSLIPFEDYGSDMLTPRKGGMSTSRREFLQSIAAVAGITTSLSGAEPRVRVLTWGRPASASPSWPSAAASALSDPQRRARPTFYRPGRRGRLILRSPVRWPHFPRRFSDE